MEYGIKVRGSWMNFLSEYNNSRRIMTFRTKEDAEAYAESLEIPNYIVEVYNDSTASKQI
jgi:dsDNA-binding SOS-regulon protein